MAYESETAKLKQELHFLEQLGYAEAMVQIESTALITMLTLEYHSNFNRQVIVSYSPSKGDRVSAISCVIRGPDEDKFLLSDWVKAHPLGSGIQFANQGHQAENEFIERFCKEFERLCLNELHSIVTGKT